MKEVKEYYNDYFENLTKLKASKTTKLNVLSRFKLDLYFADRLLDKYERKELEDKISAYQTSLLKEKEGFFERLKTKTKSR